MGKGSAPSAPDPYQSAQAQYQFGTEAANYNKGLNAVNQVTPFGTTTWSVNPSGVPQTGGTPSATPTTTPNSTGGPQVSGVQFGNNPTEYLTPAGGGMMPGTGPGGLSNPYAQAEQNVPPQYTETQTLSAPEQALLSGHQQLGLTSQGLAGQQGTNVGQALSEYQLPTQHQNQEFGSDAMKAAYGTATASMDPYWNQQQESLDASLRNSGATPGTPAYDNAMRSFQANRSSAYGQAENQAFGQGLEAQGQQISDVNAAQGGQISNFLSLMGQGTPSTGTPGSAGGSGGGSASVNAPDIMQAFQNQYQGQLAGYNANVASSNADMGALASLAAMFLMA